MKAIILDISHTETDDKQLILYIRSESWNKLLTVQYHTSSHVPLAKEMSSISARYIDRWPTASTIFPWF